MNSTSPVLHLGDYNIRRMTPADLPAVTSLEQQVFKEPWPESAYVQEIYHNSHARYFVLELTPPFALTRRRKSRSARAICGFMGVRVKRGKGHISTLAVHPEWQGQGWGEILLIVALEQVVLLKANGVRLEVRVSNEAARRLYAKYGFTIRRRLYRYYRDGEDALLLELKSLDVDYQRVLNENFRRLRAQVTHPREAAEISHILRKEKTWS
ncbi:MAG: ribosomal protein S18-alanine N-acetyltransferase [Chloroflexota bacterium]|nr:ribosomal protein S18-alanine N-acetyltransferase [Chloroflexota bacterium]